MLHYSLVVAPSATHINLQALVDGYFLQRRHHAFPVESQGHVIGIITLSQVQNIPRDQWQNRTIDAAMTSIGDNSTYSKLEVWGGKMNLT
jgi:predicted transcriptional regulator